MSYTKLVKIFNCLSSVEFNLSIAVVNVEFYQFESIWNTMAEANVAMTTYLKGNNNRADSERAGYLFGFRDRIYHCSKMLTELRNLESHQYQLIKSFVCSLSLFCAVFCYLVRLNEIEVDNNLMNANDFSYEHFAEKVKHVLVRDGYTVESAQNRVRGAERTMKWF